MNKLKKIAIAISLLCTAASASYAQTTTDNDPVEINPSWYVSPSIGAVDADTLFGVNGTGETAAIRFGKPISKDFDMQIGTSYARQRGTNTRYQQNTFGADALYLFSRKSFRPFLLAGVGAQHDKVNTPLGQIDKTSPYLSAGIGFQLSFTDQIAMQADLRRVHGFISGNSFGGGNQANNNYLSVGVVYTFDKPVHREARVFTPAPEPIVITETRPVPAAPAPAPAPIVFEKVTLASTDLFGFDSAELSRPQPKLDDMALAINNHPEVGQININGYTDRLGSSKYNLKLSQQRAESVKSYLVGKGVAADRLIARGLGEASPVVECSNKKRAELIECLEPNRRVEVEPITVERQVK